MSNRTKKVAAIHDLSGFGRCSLTAAIPILSVMGLHCCPLPTAVLSSQTGFTGYTCLNFTPYLPDFIDHWQRLGLDFDTIYSGFLGGEDQIDIVLDFVRRFKKPGTLVAIDPVMGDNGKLYPAFSQAICRPMRQLVAAADIIFPNITEALLLTGSNLCFDDITKSDINGLAADIAALGPRKIVITGGVHQDRVTNYIYDFTVNTRVEVETEYTRKSYSGTGDIFASIVCGKLTLGHDLPSSVRKAAQFIEKAAKFTEAAGGDPREGIIFEPFLKELA